MHSFVYRFFFRNVTNYLSFSIVFFLNIINRYSMEKNDYSIKWANELNRLVEIIAKTELVLATKWGMNVFTCNNKNVLGCIALKHYFALWFYNGVYLSDNAQKLQLAKDEKAKAMRQWRFASIDEIDEKLILQYVFEAIENEKAGKTWKPNKNNSFEIPTELEQALAIDEVFDIAFKNLSVYKQKEYANHIQSAKQEKTKQQRIEKSKLLILSGLGLNDKYK